MVAVSKTELPDDPVEIARQSKWGQDQLAKVQTLTHNENQADHETGRTALYDNAIDTNYTRFNRRPKRPNLAPATRRTRHTFWPLTRVVRAGWWCENAEKEGAVKAVAPSLSRGLYGVVCLLFGVGGFLLSHNLPVAVPSARAGLASGFGMGPGVSLLL